MTYSYDIDDCDVVDKGALKRFRDRRAKWINWLQGDDLHSVWSQIHTMMWNDAVFQAVNESRRLASEIGNPAATLNGLLGSFIDQSYVATQTLAIRRLVEQPSKNPDRQPISLRRVLRDVRRNRCLMTRENYVAYDGIPYDFEKPKREHHKELATRMPKGRALPLDTKGPSAWSASQRLHNHFDCLSGVSPDNRERSDLIDKTVFDQISKRLAVVQIGQVTRYTDKFIAHAADENSRSRLSNEDRKITLDKLTASHRAIIDVASMICESLLWGGSHGIIPKPPYDHFDGLDAPWVPPDALKDLYGFWERHYEMVEDWKAPELVARG